MTWRQCIIKQQNFAHKFHGKAAVVGDKISEALLIFMLIPVILSNVGMSEIKYVQAPFSFGVNGA